MIYFDNSATTAIDPQALDTYIKTSQRIMGNPSSLHELGNQAKRLLEQARKQIATSLAVSEKEIFFTSGGTEGDNWVVKGTALEKREFGNHIIISSVEHPAIKESAKQLAQLGFEISEVPVDEKGIVEVSALSELIKKDTILVSIMAVNNEVGAIQPIEEISALLEQFPKIHFHVDAVQAITKLELADWLTDRVDFATFSAHKFHGPKGVGFIFWREGRKLAPLLTGGGQEKNYRSSTENVPAIVAMAKALRLANERAIVKKNQLPRLKEALVSALKGYRKVTVFSEGPEYAPHILCFALRGIRGEVLVHAFEEKQIFISTTSACSSRNKLTSSTLYAMGVEENLATCAVRISLDEQNTMAEVEQFMIIFNQLYQKFIKVG
ncbi:MULTISPECIES: cysteine desulfurase family protein [Enterococcus]|uniref:Class V aminotransferase n=1 Tax=Enterococcus sulfureus ATCC 49903 TaxID=1140003 RepID=S0NZY2_9ENTE|nr:cysteine desulfurase family protein [Enterococcus sulfureus]EOT47225.1 class V aminotransferase [Enterococcus sulfureus ATCC 49903]EOT83480.1 class V aminotransferase [Enterococcus sulfureus ATCC 49903]